MNASTSSGDVKTGISGPIRLSDFHPIACETLVRLGNQNDGGYVIPLTRSRRQTRCFHSAFQLRVEAFFEAFVR